MRALWVALVVLAAAVVIAADKVPEITVYTASWCPPCRQMKADTKNCKDFKFKYVEYDPDTAPDWVQKLPSMSYGTGKDEWRTTGWSNLDDFRKKFKERKK